MDAQTWHSIVGGLAPSQRALIDELTGMLEKLQAPQLIPSELAFERTDGTLTITLPHHTRHDWLVTIKATARGATVRYGNAAREIYAFDGYAQSTPWSTIAVALVEEVMRGKHEVHTTFVGKRVARVEVYEVDRGGARKEKLTDEVRPASWRQWRPFARALTEVRRISYFEAE